MRKHIFGLLVAFPLVACSGNDTQVLTGRVMPGFPQAVTSVRVMRVGAVVAQGPVAADGSFRIEVAPNDGLSLQLVGSGHDTVVFPRTTGSIDRTFAIRAGGAPFDLGALRFIGSASTTAFSFHDGDTSSDCDSSGHDSGGSMCCDDSDPGDGTCEPGTGSGSGSGLGSGSGAGSTVIGRDGSSGTEGDDADDGDAVCEHDFPVSGCSGGGDDGGGSGEGSGHHGGGQEADLPYDIAPQLGSTATPILDAFAAKSSVMPTAITNVTMDAPSWRLTELQASTPFTITADDCSHIGNTGSVGRDRVFVTWQNPDGSTMVDHLDIRYCGQ